MSWELVTALPPGEASRTLLGRMGPRFAVLRQLETEPERSTRTLPPAVLTLREVAVVAAKRYAVYDVVVGVTLRELCEAFEPTPPVGLSVRAVTQAARALGAITPAKAHGGLSDSALMVGFDGDVRVLDFGAPRRNRFHVGTTPSPANDVFALAAVLHSALTGFAGNYGDAVAEGLTLPPPSQLNSQVPPALNAVVMRALARTAEARPANVTQLADELDAAMGASFGQAETARTLHATLSHRRTQLTELLGGGLASSSTSPSLGVARSPQPSDTGDDADEKTTVHLVPWVTGATKDPLPPTKAPPADGPPPRIPLDTAPAWPPLEREVEPTGPKAELGAAPDEATAPRSAMPEPLATRGEVSTRADAPRALEPAKPSAPRAPAPVLVPRPSVPRSSASRAPVALADEPQPPTETRAKPMSISHSETEERLPAVRVRNTTDDERERARGQEAVVTPPLGVRAVTLDEPESSTGEREAPSAETSGERPVSSGEHELEDDLELIAPKRGRLVLAGLLVVVALGVGALAILAPERLAALRASPAPPPEPAMEREPLEEVDAGEPDAADEAHAAMTPVTLDAGDATTEEADEEEVDSGPPLKEEKPAKKPPKKKKRRR